VVVSIVLVAYSVGGMLAPVFGLTLMPNFGWEMLFWLGGIPLLLIPLIYKKVPESSAFLLQKGRKKEVVEILSKVDDQADFSSEIEITTNDQVQSKMPIVGLFKNKRAASTLLFWVTYFMSLLMVYGLNTWLPNLMIEAGFALDSSLAFLMILQGGSIKIGRASCRERV